MRTIMITDDVYNRLARMKGKKSFSELLAELSAKRAESGKRALLRVAGVLTHEEAEEMRRMIDRTRRYGWGGAP
ncbi:MAG: antitoxin VapB family protein [Candidatus Marsarchaeota archaeon]|nr:antitoxin VapB family protein [Candidatus Marsarchaeota archaeon]